MKNFTIICFVFASFLGLIGWFICLPSTQLNTNIIDCNDFLRIHIRANSNSQIDQSIKYEVKDALVEVITPLLVDADTKEKSMCIISQNLNMLTTTANNVLANNGFNYLASCSLRQEEFPTRTYNGVTLETGLYDALIVELGSAIGNNWWCVVYPPLCFVNSDNQSDEIVYKSKLVEIIEKFFNKG